MAAIVLTETPGGDPFVGIPAGPVLAAALAEASVAQLTGQHVAAWMRATFRQRNHDDAVLLDAIRLACRSRADSCRRVLDDGLAPRIAAANLGWSAVTASARYGLAEFVLEAQPALGAAMFEGVLEARKAEIFESATEGLDENQITEVVRVVLPEAPGLAYQALRERIVEVARALDPEWAAARLAAALARARVAARPAPSGAVDLIGYDLPPDLAQDAKAHLDALAVEVRGRLTLLGVDHGVGFIAARIFTRLLDGTLAGLDDSAVQDAIVAELCGGPPGPDEPDEPDEPGPDTDDAPPDGDPPQDGPEPDEEPVVVPYPAEVALRMGLSTLLGHDRRPAELPGIGGTTADVAHRRALELGAARWQVLVHDSAGRLEHLLAWHPPPGARHDRRHRRRVVEITAPAALLDALLADAGARTDSWSSALLAAYRASREAPPEDHPATTTRDAHRRLPGAAVRRWIDARDPVCVAPGCRTLARRCEHDHTRDWRHSRRTHADGLANLCRADHRTKHLRGWRYDQPEPGRFTITDPTGTVHHTRSRVARPLPDPVAARHPRPADLRDRPPQDVPGPGTRPARRPGSAPHREEDDDPPF